MFTQVILILTIMLVWVRQRLQGLPYTPHLTLTQHLHKRLARKNILTFISLVRLKHAITRPTLYPHPTLTQHLHKRLVRRNILTFASLVRLKHAITRPTSYTPNSCTTPSQNESEQHRTIRYLPYDLPLPKLRSCLPSPILSTDQSGIHLAYTFPDLLGRIWILQSNYSKSSELRSSSAGMLWT